MSLTWRAGECAWPLGCVMTDLHLYSPFRSVSVKPKFIRWFYATVSATSLLRDFKLNETQLNKNKVSKDMPFHVGMFLNVLSYDVRH